MRISRHTLPNQLRVIVLELPHVHSVEVGIFVKAGPRLETPRTGGISHFTEHMLFKGTRSLPSTFNLHAEVERLGSPINAMTSRDHCQYYFTVPPRNLARGAELFAQIITNPTFEGLDTERQIILEELLGDLNERGEDMNAENHVRGLLWPDSALSHSILGSRDNILRFSLPELLEHHARHYTGCNSILYFAGAVTEAQALEVGRRCFASYPTGTHLQSPVTQVLQGPRFRFLDQEDSQQHLFLSFLSPPYTAPNYMAMVALQSLLTEGISSRLQWHLCESLGMVYDLDAGLETFFDTGSFDIESSAARGKLMPLLREILQVLHAMRAEPVLADELERARERYHIGFEFSLDSPGALASWMVSHELYGPPIDIDEHLASIDALTVEEVQRVAREVFHPSHMALVVSGNPSRTERRQLLRLLDGFA